MRAASLKWNKESLECAIQHLYPLELSCDAAKPVNEPPELNPETQPVRARRDAAVATQLRIRDVAEELDL